MTTFYVTFGDLLIDYHLVVEAESEGIVRTWMHKKSGISCWCRILTTEPTDTRRLRLNPTELYYSASEHI